MARIAGSRRRASTPEPFEIVDHLGLVVSLAGGVFVLVAVLGLARFDRTTALAIVESVGPVTILVRGILITALPFLVPVLMQVAMVFPRPQWWFAHHPRTFGAFLGVALLLYLGIAWPIAVFASTVLIAGFVGVLKARGGATPRSSAWGPQAVVAALAAFVATVLTAFVPWLPTQVVTHEEAGTFTGYVLKVSEEYTTVLADAPRRVVRLDNARTAFELCTRAEAVRSTASLLQLLSVAPTPAEYPACPTTTPRASNATPPDGEEA